MRHLPLLFAMLLTLSLFACGDGQEGPGTEDGGPTSAGQPPAQAPAPAKPTGPVGTWVMDVEKTLRGDEATLGGAGAAGTALPGTESYRFRLLEDGTFELEMGAGEMAFKTAGTWERKGETLLVRTTTVDGEAWEEGASIEPDVFRMEQEWLVSEQEGRRIYLLRLPEPPAEAPENE